MATASAQSTYSSGQSQNYAKKDAVAISAVNATVPRFERQLQQIRLAHGKAGMHKVETLDENGQTRTATDSQGNTIYEPKYVQAYSLVESFGHDELDPDDPASWETAQRLGRALAHDRAPGHPALVATEVNGRSGMVHNHLIIGATHPETGKQIDSNVFTHSRLAIAHDRVLEENGFTQRKDLRDITRAAEQEMERRRSEAQAEPGFDDLSPSKQRRRLTAAENSVKLQSQDERSVDQVREERRAREYDRYQLNQRDREITADIGIAVPKERFSEVELEARIRDSLSDPRSTSWDELHQIGRQHGVTIDRRGQDISYGMLLADSQGELQEPSRAHRRRGKSLGKGFRVEDVEATLERNTELGRIDESGTAKVMDVDTGFLDDYRQKRGLQRTDHSALHERVAEGADRREHEMELAEPEQHDTSVSAAASSLATEEHAPIEIRPMPSQVQETAHECESVSEIPDPPQSIEGEQQPEFRSGLRDVSASTPKMQERYNEIAAMEERWNEGLPSTPEQRRAFEQEAAAVGIGKKTLSGAQPHLRPEFHDFLEQRADHAEQGRAAVERRRALDQRVKDLRDKAKADPFNLRGTGSKLREAEADQRFETEYTKRVRQDHDNGVYISREGERSEHRKDQIARRAHEIEPTDAQRRLADDGEKLQRDKSSQRDRSQAQDQQFER